MARGKINRQAIKKDRDEAKNKGSFLSFKDEGDYLVFVGPPQEGHDNVYVECHKHFGIGPKGKGVAPCLNLDPRVNDILTDGRVLSHIEGGLDAIEGGCPRCDAWDAAENEGVRKRIGRRRQFMFNMALIGKRRDSEEEWKLVENPRLQTVECGSQLWDDVTKLVFDVGDGICNPEDAQLIIINRTGKGQNDTKYKATPDLATAKKGHAFSAKFIEEMDKGLEPNGANDLFKALARNVKTRDQILKMQTGELEEEESEGGAESETKPAGKKDGPPRCFQMDYTNDDECGSCKYRGPCSTALGVALHKGHRLQEGDVGYVAPAAKSPADVAINPAGKLSKPAAKPEPEPEEEEPNWNDYLIDEMGYTEEQVVKMTDDAYEAIIEGAYPATATSILPNGSFTLFKHKLPKDHAEYEAKSVEPEPTPEPEKPKRRSRKPADKPAPAPEPKDEEDLVDDLDDPTPAAKPPEGGGEDVLDALERRLSGSSKSRKAR